MPTFPRCASSFALVLALVASRGAGAASATPGEAHPGQRAFAIEVARQAARPGLDAAAIEAVLAQARYQQSIIDAISRPAEKTKPWRDYRPIFLTPQRAEQGLAFWRENAALLDRVSAEFGVPPEIIVAIIGVETSYGRITGRYRVLDALVTLAFYYPPRAEFFRKELAQLFLLQGETFPYQLDEVMGSYAGAMGWGQFMPSSIANYARSYDDDPRIDLWASRPDVIASVANYFAEHGWESGAPVARRARVAPNARQVSPARWAGLHQNDSIPLPSGTCRSRASSCARAAGLAGKCSRAISGTAGRPIASPSSRKASRCCAGSRSCPLAA